MLKQKYDNRKTPRALVLAPTRELCCQIYDAAKPFSRSIGIDATCIYGGADAIPQKNNLAAGCDLLIATPGRLKDFLERRQVYLDRIFFFVLDEADRMLDMGFLPQVEEILNDVKSSRQTLLWSATWPREVEELSRKVCKKEPVMIKVGSESLTINSNIKQRIICLEEDEKFRECIRTLKEFPRSNRDKILIFVNTKNGCDDISRRLENEGYDANAIHGNKAQHARDAIIGKFRSGRKNILVATDVASRGLDIKNIKVVINYDFPSGIEDYIHRIGRTGRAGEKGDSYTFFTHRDSGMASDLIGVGSTDPAS